VPLTDFQRALLATLGPAEKDGRHEALDHERFGIPLPGIPLDQQRMMPHYGKLGGVVPQVVPADHP